MPINGPSSYLETIDEFLLHWADGNTELGVGNEVVFADGTTRATLVTKRATLVTKRTAVTAALNDDETGRGDVELKKEALLARLSQFLDRVRGAFAGSRWVRSLPALPGQTEGQPIIIEALNDADDTWNEMNTDPATPAAIVLAGGYTRAMFRADIDALIAAYTTLTKAVKSLDNARSRRNDVQDEIYPILKNYRQVFPSYFVKGHALIETLPRLTPESGATPAPVTINVVFDVPQAKAKVTFNASSETNVDHYSVRYCVGHTFASDNENVIGTIAAGPGPFTFFTDAGLATPGDEISLKVYVVNDTGNEKGSNAVAIIRPSPAPPSP